MLKVADDGSVYVKVPDAQIVELAEVLELNPHITVSNAYTYTNVQEMFFDGWIFDSEKRGS